MSTDLRSPRWVDEETLACRGTTLFAVFDERSVKLPSTADRFILAKSRAMVEWYRERFAAAPPRTMLEVGIFKGGSVVLFEELWHPNKLVAVDLSRDRVTALDQYLRATGAADRVRPYYGIDQASETALRGVFARELCDAPLDLVIDDGCHYLEESRATLEALFPLLRPGGKYVIEDWGWAHWPGVWQTEGGPWKERPSMTLLALELAMASASRRDLVATVEITSDLLMVTRGNAEVSPHGFELAAACLTAGRVYGETLFDPGCLPSGAGPSRPTMTWLSRPGSEAELFCQTTATLRAMEASRSWRLTAPLRTAADFRRRMSLWADRRRG
jgi:SAM-dependent methyltransferase